MSWFAVARSEDSDLLHPFNVIASFCLGIAKRFIEFDECIYGFFSWDAVDPSIIRVEERPKLLVTHPSSKSDAVLTWIEIARYAMTSLGKLRKIV